MITFSFNSASGLAREGKLLVFVLGRLRSQVNKQAADQFCSSIKNGRTVKTDCFESEQPSNTKFMPVVS